MGVDLAGHIEDTKLAEALSERYIAYAMSTIMSRSLPDVRDGLKPVHRRLLYAMQQLRLDPTSGFKKCARVVGDVIGKFHPHGDASVYEALVRLAQDFAVRYPLVEGQGNFGSIDGDGAAAMRYTESRLTEIAQTLLDGINDDAVDFRPTYDNEDHEPIVLPGTFPNLLANGAAGIAVGMATSIPPHNAGEICRAAKLLIEKPDATVAELVEFIPGPDFPTGGILVEDRDSIIRSYETGRGSFRTRARWEVEQGRFGTWCIIVTEIPYQVQKSRLIEQIAELMEQRKLPLLGDVRDESTMDIRLVLEPKTKGCDPEVLMETMFRNTALESRFSLNMNVLDGDRVPNVLSIKQVIQAWLAHVHEVLVRRSNHRLAAVLRRLEILDGFLAVYLNLDEVIRIIREEDEPKSCLMKTFSLTDIQAEAVLNMRLRSLRRLEEMEIRKERNALADERKSLETLLGSEKRRWTRIGKDLDATIKKFGSGALGDRRTQIAQPPKAIDISAALEVDREPLTILLSREGWIRAMKGHGLDPQGHRFKEGDEAGLMTECQSTERVCLIASGGKAFTLKAADLPRGRGFGQPVRTLVDIAQEERVVAMFPVTEDGKRLIASESGRGMIVTEAGIVAEKRTGKQVFNVKDGESIFACIPAVGTHVLALGHNKRALIFPMEQVPEMTRGSGVSLQKMGDSTLRDLRVFTLENGLLWQEGQRVRAAADLAPLEGRRGAVGRAAPQWMLRKSS
ncbi:DNA topoisomerase IV subunit A [Gluconobacter thailandicus F149-1 = NBRC 100600]|uniref:DNA topoisomerase 4 subunit A n=1 Tax=Gluconobacter thailandicus NBRC 3257 TaxID=1381097 RepID=A0ABQ0ISE7_GLUTH|nr:DNA topoisomerase IV subunit A [Gluconobacter thailandicus]KXV53271.1 DNA topoisomerase IV [Gluconobacter thailandicus]GAC86920.1 DNA topoisomerase IV subunit A [Gluconobacter thailandicus NBRC 3255]GAD25111.1 DNA topoisomerase IV subunit A [Gluconobacter thailandicus NBRC 3257]GAN91887.1 DNA topoisomerase IV subunit A [Gluconobacter thailandicus F149-1 = NBRC 100600]GBR59188.1 DNA topoisomerase IV subunit A [Gluconobacter thailandicus F149-1 = NBRC 100600]